VIVGLNFAIKITVIVGFNTTRLVKVRYLLTRKLVLNSVNHALTLVITSTLGIFN